MATTQTEKPSKPATQSEKGDNAFIKAYLVAYNVSQMLGWSALMVIMVSHFISEKSYMNIYPKIEGLLQICQTAAVLEILHSMTGIVRSNWVLTAFQVYSRVFLIWGVIWSVPGTQGGYPVTMWMMAWTVTEIIRYSFYFFSLMPGPVPYFLVWCRYTFFIVLYPIGVTVMFPQLYLHMFSQRKKIIGGRDSSSSHQKKVN
ncbi:very-long-chain (3R)-3-hydroxyacyl-CoA dehydratase 2 [Aplysia californica]|uniref:Very-long-chain (3R)-3-hydroxyacyl-CoA dehydratase n=1 Tax=Aplysia californica TaxID=6500 RepID=A0ABM0JXK5_APLCA|nr:very-long-chain (3R)-3-hydroxyacyl-CoA dehydratase 2 [Aplysia californica]